MYAAFRVMLLSKPLLRGSSTMSVKLDYWQLFTCCQSVLSVPSLWPQRCHDITRGLSCPLHIILSASSPPRWDSHPNLTETWALYFTRDGCLGSQLYLPSPPPDYSSPEKDPDRGGRVAHWLGNIFISIFLRLFPANQPSARHWGRVGGFRKWILFSPTSFTSITSFTSFS